MTPTSRATRQGSKSRLRTNVPKGIVTVLLKLFFEAANENASPNQLQTALRAGRRAPGPRPSACESSGPKSSLYTDDFCLVGMISFQCLDSIIRVCLATAQIALH